MSVSRTISKIFSVKE